MKRKGLVILVLSGMFSFMTAPCFAEQHAKTPMDYHAKKYQEPTPRRTSHIIIPTKRLTHIFDNLYHHPEMLVEKDKYGDWKHYKEKLRSLAAVHFTDNIQVGFDRVKTGPNKYAKGEIVDVNSHLAPRMAGTTSRGFGLQMKVKLD